MDSSAVIERKSRIIILKLYTVSVLTLVGSVCLFCFEFFSRFELHFAIVKHYSFFLFFNLGQNIVIVYSPSIARSFYLSKVSYSLLQLFQLICTCTWFVELCLYFISILSFTILVFQWFFYWRWSFVWLFLLLLFLPFNKLLLFSFVRAPAVDPIRSISSF